MLERLLSNLKSLREKLPKKPLPQQQLPPQEEKSRQDQSPNLLADTPYLKTTALETDIKKLESVGFLQKATLILGSIFFTLLAVNAVVDSEVKKVASEIRILEKKLTEYKDIEVETKSTVDKLAVYKQKESQRTKVGENLKFIIDQAKNVVEIDTLVLRNKNTVSVDAVAPSPLNFSLLINNYFENKNIKQVTLESADLVGRTNEYSVSLTLEM